LNAPDDPSETDAAAGAGGANVPQALVGDDPVRAALASRVLEAPPLDVETRLDDPEGDAEDLRPVRSVEHNSSEVRRRRKSTRKRGERSTNPHGVRREKLSDEDAAAPDEA
jgi:hypothetical protein